MTRSNTILYGDKHDEFAECAEVYRFCRGDVNPDGATDKSDTLAIRSDLFLGVNKVTCDQAGDANVDGTRDISNAVDVLSILFLGGKAIEPPVGTCGVDPAEHSLPCAKAASQNK